MNSNFTKARALFIGISDYELVTPLPDMVRRDAVDIASAFSSPEISNYDPKHVHVLTNQEATKAKIEAELARISSDIGEDELCLFYFSGHGSRVAVAGEERSCLVAYDTDLSDLANTALLDSDLIALLTAVPSKRQVIILDACHSGGVGSLKSAGAIPALPLPGNFDALGKGSGRVLLCSSRPDEVSLALRSMSNSVFTAVLLDALRGGAADRGDGTIGVFDLFTYISAEVPKLAKQNPVFKADELEQNYAIAMRPKTKAAQSRPKRTALKPDEQIEALLCSLYPLGPMHNNIWQRAGGDASRLEISGNGASQWHTALRMLALGGGGMALEDLLVTAGQEFPNNATLAALRLSL